VVTTRVEKKTPPKRPKHQEGTRKEMSESAGRRKNW
jgi:hypothetical protein